MVAGKAPVSSSAYNALGQVIQSTDRNGNVHQYTLDAFGRQISDTVIPMAIGSTGVNGSILRIDTAYNNQGLAYLLTSYADTAGTQIVNQVENVYNGLGQLIQQYQAVTGAVAVGSTPSVQYTYSDPSTGSLLTSMVYPNGRTIEYNYSGFNLNGALDNAIGRLNSISDAGTGTILEQYSYLGLSTIVARNHPQTGINLTLIGSSGSIGAGGDEYVGLDQFGRVVNQNWVNSSGSTVDGYTYTYDNNSNVTAKNNVLDSAYSQTYTYDSLNRLTSATQGGAAYQSWNLDAQGNWSSFTNNGSTQTRTANQQNELTSVSGTSATPTYDANGNMISDQNGDTLIYDAWNRLVEVKNSSGQVIAQYTYNAQGYLVSQSYPVGGTGVPAGQINYIYYDSQWQAIETRTGGTANSNVTEQMVWSAAYINAPVLQDTYSAGVIQPNSRLYFAQDANWDTTAVIGYNSTTQTWQVVQRYVYSPYGTITILNANWSATPSGTVPLVNNLFQGMANDPVTGLYYERARWYSPSLGTWISQDPMQYINGANTYQFVMSNPVEAMDSLGLARSRYPNESEPNSYLERIGPDGQVNSRAFYNAQGQRYLRQDYSPESAPHNGVPAPHEQEQLFNEKGQPTRQVCRQLDPQTVDRTPGTGAKASPLAEAEDIAEGAADDVGEFFGDALGDIFGGATVILTSPSSLGSNDIIHVPPAPPALTSPNADFPGGQRGLPPNALRGYWA